MRRLVARLVQHPRLARLVQSEQEIAGLEGAGAELFGELVRVLHQHPDLPTQALIERFRDTEHFASLQKLAGWSDVSGERPDDEHDVEMEFRDTLARLKAEPLDTRIKALETKESVEGSLSAEDRQQLRDLLQQKADLKRNSTGKSGSMD